MGFEIINKLKKEKGLTNAQIAKMSGVTLSTLDKITAGINTNPKLDTLQAICRVLGCRLDDFDDHSRNQILDPFVSSAEISHIKKYRTLDEYGKETVDIVLDREIQRVKDIHSLTEQAAAAKEAQSAELDESQIVDIMHFLTPVSAGTGMVAYDVGGFDNLQVFSNAYTRQADFCVTVRGNSMEPRFQDGDIVMVREQDDVEFGEIGVFVVDGNSYIKQKGDGRLISLNKSVPDVYINPYHSFDCQGKIIGVLDPDWIIK